MLSRSVETNRPDGTRERVPALPRGFRDILPTEARELHALERTLMATFESYGYVPLEPPSVEFAQAASGVDERRLLRFLDRDGSLLALRPDVTTAVARVVAQRYGGAGGSAGAAADGVTSGALRLSYFTSVFRHERSMRGSEREYDQAGIELIGPAGAATDAEVVALLAEALCRCGLASAEIDIGHARFLPGLLDELAPQVRGEALARAREGDLAGLTAVARAAGLSSQRASALREALRYRGSLEPLLARQGDLSPAAATALEELRAVGDLLAPAGVTLAVRYDLGLVASLPYYTGVVFRAIAPGVGFAVASGGRYDGLLSRFGADRPATGFAIAVPYLHQALVHTGWRVDDELPLLTLEGGAPEAALAAAAALRRRGLAVAIGPVADSAGREVLPLRLLDAQRVDHGGRVLAVADVAAELPGLRGGLA